MIGAIWVSQSLQSIGWGSGAGVLAAADELLAAASSSSFDDVHPVRARASVRRAPPEAARRRRTVMINQSRRVWRDWQPRGRVRKRSAVAGTPPRPGGHPPSTSPRSYFTGT